MTDRKEAIDADVATPAEIENLLNALEQATGRRQTDALKMAREALRNIQIEAEREQGSWVHLKRVIALNCKQTLAALEQSK